MKKEISNFLKFAQEKGKIKEVEEAFQNYPVEEEWHQGKIENFGMLISSKIEKAKYKTNVILRIKPYAKPT